MLKPGDTFGDYKVVKLLGQGGMGAVYLLANAEGVEVAAKILDPATSGDHEARKRFLREAQLALGVKHPNLVETYDVGEDPETGLCYILMEYVSGGALADWIEEQGPLPIEDAVAVVEAMASVLELAREKGIVHRDIKPANIMFDAEGTPKLADLGIARVAAGLETTTVTRTGMMIGTPAYMAPEQMLDAHNVDTRADIYSLGIVFYEMLTGERPNKDDTVVQLMAKAVKGEPLPDVRMLRPEVSASLAQLLAMMVEPDRDGRISTPGQITSALNIIERGGTFESEHAKTQRREAQRAERKRRRRRRRLMLLSVFGVVVVVGLAGIGLGVAWLMRNEGEVAETGADSQPATVVSDEGDVPVVEEDASVSNVVARSVARPAPVRKPGPEAVERIVVVTNVVKEQAQVEAEEKPVAPSEPAKETKGVSDLSVRFAEVDGRTWSYALEDGEAVIWRGGSQRIVGTLPAVQPVPEGSLSVPSVLDGYKVKAIGRLAFVNCPKLTSVTISDGVRELRSGAFCKCVALKDVHLPDSLETIGKGAFNLCLSLKSVDIRNCRSVSGASFWGCPELDEIRVSDGNPSYVADGGMLLARDAPRLVFYSRSRTTVDWPNEVKEIGEGAFYGCQMEDLCVPDTVERVGDGAFGRCTRLKEVKLGQGVKVLGKRVFGQCFNLRSVDLPKSLSHVGCLLVDECRSLERIVFRGDAPKLDEEVSTGVRLGKVPEKLEILVVFGTKGWNGPGTSDLPKLWPSENAVDSRPIRYWRTEDARLPERPADVRKNAEAAGLDRKKEPNLLAVGEMDSGCWVDARMPHSHRKLKPDLKSPECRLKGSHGIEIRADRGCSTAARQLLENLRTWLAVAERIYEPPTRKKPFVITVSRRSPDSRKSAGYFLDVDTCELWLPPDDDNFESELQYIAAVVCTVCHETDWHPFVNYADRKIRQFRDRWYNPPRPWARGKGIDDVFGELELKCPDVFYRYQRLKHRRYVEGEVGSVIDYDTVTDILSHACGEDVTVVMRRHGFGKVLRRKEHPPRAAESVVPRTANDGKTFDIGWMRGSSFPKTLQRTLDAVFPPWRLGPDYQGQVKTMSGEVRTGFGTVRLGYLNKAFDRSNVVVLPTFFNGQPMTVLSCRRKMSDGEFLKCSLALGHGAANCNLVIRANGRDVHRMVLEESGRWYDFEVDLSKWKGKTPRVDIEMLSNREENLGVGVRISNAFVNVQRLEFGTK